MKIYRILVSLFLLLVHIPSFAALELLLTKGVDNATSIAIMPLQCDKSAEKMAQSITHIIEQNLKNSGRFKVIPVNQKTPVNQETLQALQKKGTDYVVFGKLTQRTPKQVQLTIRLRGQYGQKKNVFTKSYHVAPNALRSLAHHISDLIYKDITGNEGVFSTRIAYVLFKRYEDGRLHYLLKVADADGHRDVTLVDSVSPMMSPSWSPDGHEIAYVSFEKRRAAIYLLNVQTGKRRRLSDYPGINGAPAWSPDASTLAFVLSHEGSPSIYTFNMKTKKLKRVTKGRSIDTEPRYMPDGKGILFTSDRGGSPQIYRLDLLTEKVTRMTFNGPYNASAAPLPNGKAFALLHRSGGMFNIAIQDLMTGLLEELTHFAQNESPSVSPNNQMVLYASQSKGKRVLKMVSVDAKVRLTIPSPEGEIQEPAWSPYRR